MYDRYPAKYFLPVVFFKRVCPLLILLLASCTTFDGQDKTHTNPSLSPVIFFQKYISPVDGARCQMHPSCSQYSIESIRKFGMLKGWIMTCDRLMRCGRDELNQAPPVIINGEKYCFDSVEDNVFWWVEDSPSGINHP